MSSDAAPTTSIWTAETSSPSPLGANARTDVCVVGAGISGMTTAYLLARQGKSVVVLEAGSVGGGEDHKVGEQDDGHERFAKLYRWTQRRFPMAQKIEYQWSGQILEPADSLAFIGRKPQATPNVYIATGDSGHGLTHGTIAGILLTDLIFGRPNPWACLYDPLRLRSLATTDFLVGNLSVLTHYADWLTGGEVSSAKEIQPGEGRILRRGLTKIAAYRDEYGVLYERQAICQHLGCIVAWNSTERSWDCPCHGARYDALGRVLNGPTNSDLVGGDEAR